MRILKLASGLMVSGVIPALLIYGSASAWSPTGAISKSVQDVTTNSALVPASSDATAMEVHPGDIVKYEVVISNTAQAASDSQNDMADTVFTDTLPSGVQLISDPSMQSINENIGTVQPGQKVVKDYTVKVTDKTDGDILINKACYTGNSIVNDSPQNGCATSEIKINLPATQSTPTPSTPASSAPTPPSHSPTPAPATTAAPSRASSKMPNTGPGDFAAPALALLATFAGYLYSIRRKTA